MEYFDKLMKSAKLEKKKASLGDTINQEGAYVLDTDK